VPKGLIAQGFSTCGSRAVTNRKKNKLKQGKDSHILKKKKGSYELSLKLLGVSPKSKVSVWTPAGILLL
jgi:hypothetical protein